MGMESVYKLSVLVNMIDRITGPATLVQRAVGGTVSTIQDYQAGIQQMTKSGAVMVGSGVAMATAATLPVKATFATQDALSELASLGVTKLGTLEDAAKDFSNTWAGTTKAQFLTAAYDIKSGIASLSDDGVAGMTRIAGVTAKATKSTATEMTSLFATGYGIYKDYYSSLSDLEFGEMFSSGISKSVQQFKTTGSGMAQAISALGGSATAAGAPLEEQLAILGMLQATMSGSEAGTKYTAFLQNAASAGGELGLSFTDTNGQMLAMPQILNEIRGKFGEVMTAADKLELQKAFGTVEAVKLIELLYGKTDDLQSNILTLYDTMGQGMSITEGMANKINAPPGQQWQLLQQRFQSITETVGNAMLPAFGRVMAKAEDVTGSIASWVTENGRLAGSIMQGVAAFGMAIAGVGLLKVAIGGVGSIVLNSISIVKSAKLGFMMLKDGITYARIAMMLMGDKLAPLKSGFLALCGGLKSGTLGLLAWAKQGIVSAAAALPGLIAGVWSFTAALLANPITWVVVGIVALIAALVLLWQNWDSVSAWISNTWNAVCSGIMSAIDWLKSGFDKIIGWFGSLSGWVQGAIAVFMPFIGIPMLIVSHWEQVKSFFIGLVDWFKNIGANIMQGFTNGIMNFINAPFDAVKGALEKVRQLLPFSDAKTGPLSDLTLSGQRVFETMNAGMMTTADLPAQTVESAFADIGTAAHTSTVAAPPTASTSSTQERGVTINKLELKVDLASIEDLKKLKMLILEMEDVVNSNSSVSPSPAY